MWIHKSNKAIPFIVDVKPTEAYGRCNNFYRRPATLPPDTSLPLNRDPVSNHDTANEAGSVRSHSFESVGRMPDFQ